MRLLGLALAFSLSLPLLGEPKVGDVFPSPAEAGLEGQVPDLKGKVVVVDFWASWCGPCRAAFPTLQEIHTTYAEKGVVVLGISLDEDKPDMDAFIAKMKTTFPNVRDPKGTFARKLKVEGIPTTYIVGPDGKVAAVHVGFEGPKSKKAYVATIDKLLAAQAKPVASR